MWICIECCLTSCRTVNNKCWTKKNVLVSSKRKIGYYFFIFLFEHCKYLFSCSSIKQVPTAVSFCLQPFQAVTWFAMRIQLINWCKRCLFQLVSGQVSPERKTYFMLLFLLFETLYWARFRRNLALDFSSNKKNGNYTLQSLVT